MNRFTELKDELVTLLQAEFAQECTVMGEYPGDWRRFPPKRPCIAVGLAGVSVEETCAAGMRVRLRLRFDILYPSQLHGGGCHALFERICGVLTRGQRQFGLSEISCGELERERELSALLLTVGAVFQGLLIQEEGLPQPGEPLERIEFEAKGVLQ